MDAQIQEKRNKEKGKYTEIRGALRGKTGTMGISDGLEER